MAEDPCPRGNLTVRIPASPARPDLAPGWSPPVAGSESRPLPWQLRSPPDTRGGPPL
jgi:hypothetical protein